MTRTGICMDCRQGRVVFRSDFYGYWEDRFTREEILEMAKAVFG